MPNRPLINQCQIITFLILRSDIRENSRIDLKGIVLPVPSIKLKLHLLLFYPSTWYICDFFLFHIEIEVKCGWIIGGGGGKGYVAPFLKLLPPPPLFLRLCTVFVQKPSKILAINRDIISTLAATCIYRTCESMELMILEDNSTSIQKL